MTVILADKGYKVSLRDVAFGYPKRFAGCSISVTQVKSRLALTQLGFDKIVFHSVSLEFFRE